MLDKLNLKKSLKTFPFRFHPVTQPISSLFIFRHFRALCSYTGIMAMQTALPLIALPWLARILSGNDFGALLYFCLFPPVGALIVDWGTSIAGTRSAACSRGKDKDLSQLLGSVLSARTILAIGLCALGFFFYPFIPKNLQMPVPYALAIFAGLSRGINPIWFFQGINRHLVPIALLDIFTSLVILAATFLFINNSAKWYLYLLFLGSFKFIIYGSIIFWLFLQYRPKFDIYKGIKIIIKSFPFFGASLAQIICFNGTQLVLAFWLTTDSIGILAAVTKMLRAFAGLIQPFTQTIFPEVCILCSQDKRNSFSLLRWSLVITALCAFLAAFAIWLVAPWIITLSLGHEYEKAIPVLRIMIWCAPFMAINNMLSTQIMASWKLEKSQFYCIASMALCSILTCAIYGSLFDLTLAAYWPICTETTLTLLYLSIILCYCRKNHG